jgi:hypothetical protein
MRRGQLRTHNRDREDDDNEQAFEHEQERRRPRGERGLRTHGHVEHYEDNRLDRDPAQDVADRDPEVVRERR